MKVLFIQIIEKLAGSEKYFLECIPLLKAKGIDCEFLAVYRTNIKTKFRDVTDAMEDLDIKVHYIPTATSINFPLLKSINKVIKEGDFDLVHGHLLYSDVWLSLIKIMYNRKLKIGSTKHSYDLKFAELYGFDSSKRLYNLYYFLCRFSEKFINRSFTVSHSLRKLFIDLKISKADKMDVIYHAFESKYLPAENSEEYRFAPQQLVLVGRMIEMKGHRFTIDALSIVVKKFPKVQLVFVGDGPEKPKIKKQIEELGLADNIQFVGYRNDAMHFMANSDITLVSSTAEAFGIVYIESFEVKTPVITFDVPAGNELIKNEISGCLIEPFNSQKMADKIIELLEQPEKRIALAEAAFDRLNSELSSENMINKTIEFYNKILDEK